MLKRWAAWLFRLKITWKSALGAATRGSPISPRQRHPFLQTPSHHPLTLAHAVRLQRLNPSYSLCSWFSRLRIWSLFFTLIKLMLLLALFYLCCIIFTYFIIFWKTHYLQKKIIKCFSVNEIRNNSSWGVCFITITDIYPSCYWST